MEDVMAEKYGVDLSDKPIMITVRGHAQKKDGRIHTDSKTKFLTCLLYLNDIWDESEARLRMLRKPDDIQDFANVASVRAETLYSLDPRDYQTARQHLLAASPRPRSRVAGPGDTPAFRWPLARSAPALARMAIG